MFNYLRPRPPPPLRPPPDVPLPLFDPPLGREYEPPRFEEPLLGREYEPLLLELLLGREYEPPRLDEPRLPLFELFTPLLFLCERPEP